jgi:hypothetical protein
MEKCEKLDLCDIERGQAVDFLNPIDIAVRGRMMLAWYNGEISWDGSSGRDNV